MRWADGARAAAAVAVTVGANVTAHKAAPDPLHVPLNLAAAGSVAGLAIWSGASAESLGLAPRHAVRGVAVGLAAAAVAGGVVSVIGVLDREGRALHDDRVAGASRARAGYELGVRIPFGTALAEELLFRAALPAVLAPVTGARAARLTSAGLFGLWHVLPTVASVEDALDEGPHPEPWAVAGRVAITVLATAAAAEVFGILARRSRSVLAPALAHSAINSATYAWVRHRTRGRAVVG